MDSSHVDRLFTCRVAPFGDPRVNAYLRLTVAYRSLSRPSSAPDAKASSLRPCSLDRRPRGCRDSQRSAHAFGAGLTLRSLTSLVLSVRDPLRWARGRFGCENYRQLQSSCPRIMQAPLTEVVS